MNNRLQHPIFQLFAVTLFVALVIDPCATDPRPGGIFGGAFGYLGIGNYGYGYPRYGGYGGGSYGKGYGGGYGNGYGNGYGISGSYGFGYPNYGGYGGYYGSPFYNTPFYGR